MDSKCKTHPRLTETSHQVNTRTGITGEVEESISAQEEDVILSEDTRGILNHDGRIVK